MPDIGLSGLNNLNNLSGIVNMLQNESAPSVSLNDTEESFSDVLTDAFTQYQKSEAGNTVDTLTLLTGNTEDLSSTMIATQKAELALNLTISVRNKVISAYNQIINMQV
jgi:flagellar hook-basal body complex protein FliE